VSTRPQIEIRGIPVEIVRKDIKNLHLGVYPPNGRVRVAAPLRLSDDAIRLAVISRLGWIGRQRTAFVSQDRQSEREMVSGETHFVWGRRYRLKVIEQAGPALVRLRNRRWLEMSVRPGMDRLAREGILNGWYREILRKEIPYLIEKWSRRVKVQVADWGIRKMKTKWGSCNARDRRIWVNMELAKKPTSCLEYIVMHEMVHLIERHTTIVFVITWIG
jgi:predicted metal-dependent hydrolase